MKFDQTSPKNLTEQINLNIALKIIVVYLTHKIVNLGTKQPLFPHP